MTDPHITPPPPRSIDVYSDEYRRLLQADSQSHARRTTESYDSPAQYPWTYDPVRTRVHARWAYERIIGDELRRYCALLHRTFNRPSNVVDLGCGPGGSSLLIALAGHHVIGIDACAERIEIAQTIAIDHRDAVARAGGKLDYACCDFFRFEPPHALDAVVSVKTLHHVPDVEQLLRRCCTWLGEKGYICVFDQVGESNLSHYLSKVCIATLPPGLCEQAWLSRVRSGSGALLRATGLLKEEVRSQAEVEADPLEGVGQAEVLPAFNAVFSQVDVRNMDPLRVLFLANALKPWACRPAVTAPYVLLNQLLQKTGPSLEKSIIANKMHLRPSRG